MRLIDADALFDKVYEFYGNDNEDNENWMMGMINDAPTIDAVEVVRCGECKRYDPLDRKRPFFCPVMDCATGVMEDDFCSRGERRAKTEAQE